MASEIVVRILMQNSCDIIRGLAAAQYPSLHLSFDESRICSRDVMLLLVSQGNKVFCAPLQTVRDSKLDLSKTALDRHESLQSCILERKPKERPPPKQPSIVLYGALHNSLSRLAAFTFDFCRPEFPLKAVGRHEVREESTSHPGWHYVKNVDTGSHIVAS